MADLNEHAASAMAMDRTMIRDDSIQLPKDCASEGRRSGLAGSIDAAFDSNGNADLESPGDQTAATIKAKKKGRKLVITDIEDRTRLGRDARGVAAIQRVFMDGISSESPRCGHATTLDAAAEAEHTGATSPDEKHVEETVGNDGDAPDGEVITEPPPVVFSGPGHRATNSPAATAGPLSTQQSYWLEHVVPLLAGPELPQASPSVHRSLGLGPKRYWSIRSSNDKPTPPESDEDSEEWTVNARGYHASSIRLMREMAKGDLVLWTYVGHGPPGHRRHTQERGIIGAAEVTTGWTYSDSDENSPGFVTLAWVEKFDRMIAESWIRTNRAYKHQYRSVAVSNTRNKQITSVMKPVFEALMLHAPREGAETHYTHEWGTRPGPNVGW